MTENQRIADELERRLKAPTRDAAEGAGRIECSATLHPLDTPKPVPPPDGADECPHCGWASPATGAAEPDAQMLEYARRLNEFATNCEVDGNLRDASDLRRIAQQIVATPPVRGDREEIRKVFDGWLERFEHGDPIQYTPAREYAADAVRDCRDAVLALLPVQPGAGEREAVIESAAKIAQPWASGETFASIDAVDVAIIKVRTEIATSIRGLSRQPPQSSREDDTEHKTG